MEADEAAELMETGRETDRFKHYCAITISFFAMLLAVTGLGGQNATKEALNSNVQASNFYSFYQAKNQRQASIGLAEDAIELALIAQGANLSEAARAAMQEKAEEYRRTMARYETEPSTQEGKKELLARAKVEEAKRDIALRKDPYFDFAETFLQIAIVLISVALLSGQKWLVLAGGTLGVVGALLMVNGYLLLVTISFLE